MCGHTPTENLPFRNDLYLDTAKSSIWCNERKNVYLLDCGSGFGMGKLACFCIETGERFYSSEQESIGSVLMAQIDIYTYLYYNIITTI